jgi:hypothetical protein
MHVFRVLEYLKESIQKLTTFLCSLFEAIAKICKKLKYNNGFLSYLQDRTAHPAHLAAIFLPYVCLPSKRYYYY